MNEQNNVAQPAVVVTLTRTLGAYGAAFDLPGPHRAFTYHHQPGNIGAHRLGAAWQKAASGSSGDLIDRGLGLLKALQEVGFGVFEVSEIAAPADEQNVLCCDAVMGFRRSGAAFPAHPLPVFSAGKWTYDGTGQAFDYKDLDEAAFSVYRAALASAPVASARAALAQLEAACDTLCRLRTQEQYLSMVDSGQQDALLALDDARAQARAALASAPVADEREDFEAWLYLGQTEFEPDDLNKDAINLAQLAYSAGRAALASAPVADLRPHLEWALRRIRTSLDTGDKYGAAQAALDAAKAAPVASAPVAGEAQPLGYVRKGREWPNQCYYPSSHKPTDIHNWTPVFDHAAPQASAEDVRNAIETCAKICDGRSASLMQSGMLTASNEAHKCGMAIRSRAKELLSLTQAHKDGGQQRAGDAFPDYMHDLRYHDQFRIGWNRCVDAYRSALSATQAGQGDTREA